MMFPLPISGKCIKSGAYVTISTHSRYYNIHSCNDYATICHVHSKTSIPHPKLSIGESVMGIMAKLWLTRQTLTFATLCNLYS